MLLYKKAVIIISSLRTEEGEQPRMAEPVDRKARLAALAARAGRTNSDKGDAEKVDIKPVLSFRNYAPKDSSLDAVAESSSEPATKRSKVAEPNDDEAGSTSALELALQKARQQQQDANTSTTDPSSDKINWDLKRDIAGKLQKLERRTQRAIVELLRERLEQEAAQEDNDGESEGDLD